MTFTRDLDQCSITGCQELQDTRGRESSHGLYLAQRTSTWRQGSPAAGGSRPVDGPGVGSPVVGSPAAGSPGVGSPAVGSPGVGSPGVGSLVGGSLAGADSPAGAAARMPEVSGMNILASMGC